MITIFYLVIYFSFYSFFGWICETIYCSIGQRKFVNRGFLNGPFCPIYGFGAIILTLCLSDFKNNIILLFLLSAILMSILEYITSYVMEKMFHARWWDYSKNKFNINGRVCLKNSTMFGLMSVIFIEVIHPFIYNIVAGWSYGLVRNIAIIMLSYFIVDLVVSIITVMKINNTLLQIKFDPAMIKKKFEENVVGKRFAIRAKSRRLFYKRVIHAFPNIQYKSHYDALPRLKELLTKERKNKN